MSTDPLWINEDNGEPAYSAVELRRNTAALLTHGVGDGLGARAGIRPGGSPAVTLSGQTVSIHPRPVVVYPGLSSTDGPYIGHLVTDSHTLDPADGSNPRVDIVVMRVYDDDHDSSGRRELVTEYIAGTPAASPVPEPTPAGATLLATIDVLAGGSPAPSLEYLAPFTVASGGILPLRDDEAFPSSGVYEGMYADRDGLLYRRGGSDWRPMRGWQPIASGDESSLSFDVEPGLYSTIRVHMIGQLSALGFVAFRCNGETGGIWEVNYINFDANNGGAVDSSFSDDGEAQAIVGRWSTRTSRGEFTIYGTDGASGVRPYAGSFTRSPTSSGNFALVTESHGRTMSGADPIESIQLVARNTDNTAENTYSLLSWQAEGYIA